MPGPYLVRWEMDFDEYEYPREAAEEARKTLLDPNSEATVFEVIEKGEGGDTFSVDLDIPYDEMCLHCCVPYTDKDIEGGRCLSCGSMICAEIP